MVTSMKERVFESDHCTIRLINGDCMTAMAEMEKNQFDLAIVDPPYGIGEDGGKKRTRKSQKTNGVKKGWDNKRPSRLYFEILQERSRHQIIFGGNYFSDLLPPSQCWLYWQKELGGDFADGELIYTSFKGVLRQFKKRSETFNRIHPTQKPVALYKWLFKNYAKQGDEILDTHGGSMSIALAALDLGFNLTLYEIDKDYYKAGVKRFEEHIRKPQLFTPSEMYQSRHEERW